MDRRTFLATASVGTSIALAGCFEGNPEDTVDHDVGMTIDSFRPDHLTVAPGTEVEFVNTSSHAHTVTAFDRGIPEDAEYFASGGYDSEQEAIDAWDAGSGGALYQGDAYTHTFEIPGVYDYYCIPHIRADMIGTIEVTEEE